MIKRSNRAILALIMVLVFLIIFVPACSPSTADEAGIDKNIDPDDFSSENINIDGMAGPDEYPFSYEDKETGIVMYWFNDSRNLYLCLESQSAGWTAIGFDPGFVKKGANIILFAMDSENVIVRDDYGVSSYSHSSDQDLGGSFDIIQYAGKKVGSGATFEFVLPLKSGDEFDKFLEPGNTYKVILAINSIDINFTVKHTNASSTTITLK